MKHIKLLYIVSFIFLTQDVLIAQKILDGAKFLHMTYDGGPRATVNFDQIYKISVGSINVYKFNNQIILEKGEKIYYKWGNDTVLYYDYSLKAGDTFYFNHPPTRTEFMAVDSIIMKELNDGKFYKHWYLKSEKQSIPIIWVEGLGEKNMGWYAYDLIPIHSTKLKSICMIDTLIFWDTTFNGFEPFSESPTCDFHRLLKYNSTGKINIRQHLIFPNPVSNEITITGFEGFQYEIYNLIGQKVTNGILLESINTNKLDKGTYILKILTDKGFHSWKFMKN